MVNHINELVQIQPAIPVAVGELMHLLRHKIRDVVVVLSALYHVAQLAHVDEAVPVPVVLKTHARGYEEWETCRFRYLVENPLPVLVPGVERNFRLPLGVVVAPSFRHLALTDSLAIAEGDILSPNTSPVRFGTLLTLLNLKISAGLPIAVLA